MNDWLAGAVIALGSAASVVLIVLLVRDKPAQDRTFVSLGCIELVLLAQLVVGSIALAHTERDVSAVLFVSYLVGVVLALPIGIFWSLAERNRAGTGVLVVSVLTVIALQLRLETIWGGAGA